MVGASMVGGALSLPPSIEARLAWATGVSPS